MFGGTHNTTPVASELATSLISDKLATLCRVQNPSLTAGNSTHCQ